MSNAQSVGYLSPSESFSIMSTESEVVFTANQTSPEISEIRINQCLVDLSLSRFPPNAHQHKC